MSRVAARVVTAIAALAFVLAGAPAANADEAACANSTFYSEAGTGGFFHPITLAEQSVPEPLRGTGYDCAVSSEDSAARQQSLYVLVFATTTWGEFLDILAAFDDAGWDLRSSEVLIDRGAGETFEPYETPNPDESPLLYSPLAVAGDGTTVSFRYVDSPDRYVLDPSFNGPQLEVRVFISASVTAPLAPTSTGLADPSVLSELKTVADAVPSQNQAAVIGVTSVLLMLLVGYPGFLLSRVVASRYDQLFGWTRRGAAKRITDRLAAKQPSWMLWAGLAAAAIVASFIDPQFGLNPMSLRILLTLFAAFVVYNLFGWMVVKAVLRRIEPTAQPVLQFRWGSILVVAVAVLISRLLGFSPGIIFGIVAGLTFAATLVLARRAVVVLIGSGFALAAGLMAWLLYSLLTAAPENLATVTLTELFSAIAIEGIATLPLALLPFAAFDGAVLSRWKIWVWALSYAAAMGVFLLVLVTAPAGFAAIPGDFLRWVLLFVLFAVMSIFVWLLDARARKRAEARAVTVAD